MGEAKQLRHNIRIWIGICFAVLLVVFNGWVFGLWGRLLEIRFEHVIRVGMPEEEVNRLWSQSGDAFGPADTYSNQVTYAFIDWETFCFEQGNQFVVTFDDDRRVTSWAEKPWEFGC